MPKGCYTRKTIDLKTRLFNKVKKTKGCWIWTGCEASKGYGQIQIGRGTGAKLVHRVSYELAYGQFDKKLCVLHKCDNPPCVRPSHLFLGTRNDNNQDMIKKGRNAKGSKQFHSKLTERGVERMRGLWGLGCFSQKGIAKLFGVSVPTVSEVVNRKTWRHVS